MASGPGRNIFESTKIVGSRIYKGASKLLMARTGRELTGPISFIHQFIDMPKQSISYFSQKLQRNQTVRGCLPAMGYSFAAGTTDGPGAFNFAQGTTTDNPFWNTVRDFIAEPSAEDIACHGQKPILLATGRAVYPYAWQPTVVPTQIFAIGDVLMFGLPGEFTTMAGRRLKSEIQRITKQSGSEVRSILCGLSNIYTSYVTTPEEYDVQRYEGASTIFGPHSLPIYIHQFSRLLIAMLNGEELTPGPMPADQVGDHRFCRDNVFSLFFFRTRNKSLSSPTFITTVTPTSRASGMSKCSRDDPTTSAKPSPHRLWLAILATIL